GRVGGPRARAEVVNVALPPESVPVPNVVAPSLKVTVPVGVPAPGAVALTVAVKVTPWPDTEGLSEEVTAVVSALAAAGTTSRPARTVLGSLPPKSRRRRVNWPSLTVTV